MGRPSRIPLVALAIVAMGTLLVPDDASALVVCARRSGTLVLRTACKRRETTVDLAQLGAVGPQGPAGERGAAGSPGTMGVDGAPGTAAAYAVVDPHPVVGTAPEFVAAKTKNFLAVASPMTGVYCLTPASGIDPTLRPAVVAPEWGLSTPDFNSYFAYFNAYNGSGNCPAGDFEVETYLLPTGGSTVPDAQPADYVAFVIIVP